MSEIDDCYQRMLDNLETTELSHFSKTIISELEELNNPELKTLIDELKQGKFDDFNSNAYPLPRMELVDRLYALELHNIAKRIINGKYSILN